MAFDPATLLSRTVAGDAELSTPRNGLSLGQRRLLTYLDQPQALEELAAEHALEATKLERDLAKLASLNLIAINGNGAPPAAASVVIGGVRTQSLLRWLLPPLLLVGAGLVYFAMSAPSPRKVEAPPTRLSAAPAGVVAPVAPPAVAPAVAPAIASTAPPVASVAAITDAAARDAGAGTARDAGVPAHSAAARVPPEPLQTANATTKSLPPDTFKSTATQETARTPAPGEAGRAAAANPAHADKIAPADADSVRVASEAGRAAARSDASPPEPALPLPRGERALANAAQAGANGTVAPASAATGATAVTKPPSAVAAATSGAALANGVSNATVAPTAAAPGAISPPPNPSSPQPAAAPAPAPVKLALAAPGAAVAHAPAAMKLLPLTREDPEFPREALVRGVASGSVKARLAIDAAGKVTTVSIVDARPSRIFDRSVTQALSHWTFPAGDAGRSTEVEIAFKRD